MKLNKFFSCASYVPGSGTVIIDALPASYSIVFLVNFKPLPIHKCSEVIVNSNTSVEPLNPFKICPTCPDIVTDAVDVFEFIEIVSGCKLFDDVLA